MWTRGWRKDVWSRLDQPWDIIVIGGGITGAGILREAVRIGLKTLLVEQGDFASGTSSRSSKMVHGGLRYLKSGKLGLTRDAVHERNRLLDEGPGLVERMGFLLANYRGEKPRPWKYKAALSIYDLLAAQWSHRHYSADRLLMLAPNIARNGIDGGFQYGDAQTDDARLVLRVIKEGVAAGGVALNYAMVEQLIERDGKRGVRVQDVGTGQTADLYARVVVNATGAWADGLRAQVDAPPRLRPLRGSHLVFPAWKFPVAQAISFPHPLGGRPVFAVPWEGSTLVGTTDLDYCGPMDGDPAITPDEVAYLMAAVDVRFPALNLTLDDVTSTYSGVRPVVRSGKETSPSDESRDHAVWDENGLLTVTGGKLTTFRLIAHHALEAARNRIPEMGKLNRNGPVLDKVIDDLPGDSPLSRGDRRRVLGRYGAEARALIASACPDELQPIPNTRTLWAELRWAARAEGVVHLDDLLLRRVRIGLLLPEGGRTHFDRIQAICEEELCWDDGRWAEEATTYMALWHRSYSLPDRSTIPDWRTLAAKA